MKSKLLWIAFIMLLAINGFSQKKKVVLDSAVAMFYYHSVLELQSCKPRLVSCQAMNDSLFYAMSLSKEALKLSQDNEASCRQQMTYLGSEFSLEKKIMEEESRKKATKRFWQGAASATGAILLIVVFALL